MAYSIVLTEQNPPGHPKAVGENVFLANMPTSPKVFVFFYPGDKDTEEVEQRLRALGQRTGENLYVNIGSLVDPDYKRAVEIFRIGPLPVIVITAVAALAATPAGSSAFVRLDGESLLGKPERLVRTVEELFNLFLAGRIRQAAIVGWTHQGAAAIADAAKRVWSIISPVVGWISTRDIKVELAGAKFDVKASGAE